ncbi:uncharacterized protein TRIADDRAFT_31936 [Trichoplax adhaerens]|uniref:Solute carrier family 25 member 51 n=1 Tax=Trichoplax adhaerens TaxID=10228 RepID=B3S9X7_TRIAD|nr:hypothetical protein TRIADDRAFT_31936 [Trichoplax adhaerens]EDV20413.1 hypothetical protein TRIADDRAFT_31936 [Trichoplax adhaerens]|eukprot:XP_002117107.1 hypothetical protein TRIADDRAFT_31936 [Trichoplax adhaerens]
MLIYLPRNHFSSIKNNATSVHFNVTEGYSSTQIRSNVSPNSKSSPEFVCGAGAAFANIVLTFPVNKAIFRQQIHGINLSSAVKQLQLEGVRNLYRGLGPPLLLKCTTLSLTFGLYDFYNKQIHRWNHGSTLPALPVKLLAATLAGTTEAILTPFERVQVLLQDRHQQRKYTNTVQAFHNLKRFGLKEYYRGLTPILIRNGPSNAVYFALREPVRNILPNYQSSAGNIASDFVSGAVLGAVISTMYYPLNVVKSVMQRKAGGEFTSFNKTFIKVFNDRNRSVQKLYYGVQANFMRSLISWGIINATYEILKRNFFQPDNIKSL